MLLFFSRIGNLFTNLWQSDVSLTTTSSTVVVAPLLQFPLLPRKKVVEFEIQEIIKNAALLGKRNSIGQLHDEVSGKLTERFRFTAERIINALSKDINFEDYLVCTDLKGTKAPRDQMYAKANMAAIWT